MDINVFAKFDEIPSLPVQESKENQNVVDKELQRAITLTELAPSPYFSIINVHLVDINVFAKSHEIQSLPIQIIKEKPKCHREDLQRAITLKELAPCPCFSIINVHLVDINVFAKLYEIPALPFQDTEKQKRRGQTDRLTDVLTDGYLSG